MITVRHSVDALAGRIQADNVIPVVRSRLAASGTSTRSSSPSNDSAPPFLPAAVHVAPFRVPLFPVPERSVTADPEPSLKLYAATRPVMAELATVTDTAAEVVVFPTASRRRR